MFRSSRRSSCPNGRVERREGMNESFTSSLSSGREIPFHRRSPQAISSWAEGLRTLPTYLPTCTNWNYLEMSASVGMQSTCSEKRSYGNQTDRFTVYETISIKLVYLKGGVRVDGWKGTVFYMVWNQLPRAIRLRWYLLHPSGILCGINKFPDEAYFLVAK